MFPAAMRLLLGFSLGALAPVGGRSAESVPARASPSRPASPAGGSSAKPSAARSSVPAPAARPAPLSTRRIGKTDYVDAADIADRLGLKLTWVTRGRKLTLAGPGVRADLERDTRDISVNGVRVLLGDPIADASGKLYISRVDFERCLAPMLRPGYGVSPLPAPRVIVLDPGHGGTDPGKVNEKLRINEKTFTLDVARRVQKLLEAGGQRVRLTRTDDSFVALPQRTAIAAGHRADLFVSIHFNALPNDVRTSGVEVYTFAPQHQRSTDAWSVGQKDDTEKHASPGNRFDHWNVALAHAIHRRFVHDLKVMDRGKKLKHLGVLRGLPCPGALIECGFLTSEAEARKIATPEYRQKLAETLAAGIRDYISALDRGAAQSAATVQAAAQSRHAS